MTLLTQLLVNGLITGVIYSLLAVSFGTVYRSTRVFHIALGAIYTASAYGIYVGKNAGLAIGVFAGLGVAIALSLLIEWCIYRPFLKKGSSPGVVLIASLGAYILIENLIALLFGNEVKIIHTGIEPSISIGALILTRIQIIQFFIGILFLIGSLVAFKKSRFFKAAWAMGDEPLLLEVLGLPVFKLRELIFCFSAILCATTSMLVALDVGVDPHVGLSAILLGAVAVLVGGMDNILGWIFAAFLLAELQSLAIWWFSARWNDAISFALLIFVLLFRPTGLFTKEVRIEER